ncbi:hypothetical protein SAMN06297387_1349 [Streptomyces zhaozhouensis]|uniref:Uncharacterized protein n=1 Tax=Streptomyces zhaozhouensis TaxID=1300267 RepID=A0A286EA46_9ACTN|nr:hypothetical protein SAMN06297387_1349 [Streptomyces zhaozhouensis]
MNSRCATGGATGLRHTSLKWGNRRPPHTGHPPAARPPPPPRRTPPEPGKHGDDRPAASRERCGKHRTIPVGQGILIGTPGTAMKHSIKRCYRALRVARPTRHGLGGARLQAIEPRSRVTALCPPFHGLCGLVGPTQKVKGTTLHADRLTAWANRARPAESHARDPAPVSTVSAWALPAPGTPPVVMVRRLPGHYRRVDHASGRAEYDPGHAGTNSGSRRDLERSERCAFTHPRRNCSVTRTCRRASDDTGMTCHARSAA